ncbi:methyltransferase domain-containing protein [Actinomycetes bacterium KLBMP 9759]
MHPALARLARPEYPRSSTYDPEWLTASDMGPNPLWLLEDLANDLDLRPGMRVLDLGSGKGATSVFLAREFGVQVWAADLWVSPEDVLPTLDRFDVTSSVTPLKAEAHALPFATGFFDVIVSIDAFEYFGTADGYLAYLVRFLRPGGQLGIATPAMRRDPRELGGIPAHIRECVRWEALSWHPAEWWRFHWDTTELVTVTSARMQESGWRDWLTWAEVGDELRGETDGLSVTMLRADGGEHLTFALVTARRI